MKFKPHFILIIRLAQQIIKANNQLQLIKKNLKKIEKKKW